MDREIIINEEHYQRIIIREMIRVAIIRVMRNIT